MSKNLAIIAGNGQMPQILIDSCIKKDQKFILFLLNDQKYEIDYSKYSPIYINYGEIDRFLKILKENKVDDLVMIGGVTKPNFATLKVDKKGAILLGKILANKILGDDYVLKTVVKFFKNHGLNIIAIDQILNCVVKKKGVLTKTKPSKDDLENINLGKKIINNLSKFDIGQSIIIAQKQVIAIEAVEGTDQMINRIKDLDVDYKNQAILIKQKKKNQSRKADLPTIGIETIKNCHKSSIKGIAIKSNSTIILEKDKVVKEADKLNIFIISI